MAWIGLPSKCNRCTEVFAPMTKETSVISFPLKTGDSVTNEQQGLFLVAEVLLRDATGKRRPRSTHQPFSGAVPLLWRRLAILWILLRYHQEVARRVAIHSFGVQSNAQKFACGRLMSWRDVEVLNERRKPSLSVHVVWKRKPYVFIMAFHFYRLFRSCYLHFHSVNHYIHVCCCTLYYEYEC